MAAVNKPAVTAGMWLRPDFTTTVHRAFQDAHHRKSSTGAVPNQASMPFYWTISTPSAPNPGIHLAGLPIGLPFVPDPALINTYRSAGGLQPFTVNNQLWPTYVEDTLVRRAVEQLPNLVADRAVRVVAEDPRLVILSEGDRDMEIKSSKACLLALIPGHQTGDGIEMTYGDVADTLSRVKEDPYTSEFLIWRAEARCTIHPPKKGSRLLILYSLSNTASPTQELYRQMLDFKNVANPPGVPSPEGPVSPNIPNVAPLSLVPAASSVAMQIRFFVLPNTGDHARLREYVAVEGSRFGFASLFGGCTGYTVPPKTPAGSSSGVLLRVSAFTNSRNQPLPYVEGLIFDPSTMRVVIETSNRRVPLNHLPKTHAIPNICVWWNRAHQWPVLCEDVGWTTDLCISRCASFLRELDRDNKMQALQNFNALFRNIYWTRGMWSPIETLVAVALDVFGAPIFADAVLKMFRHRRLLRTNITALLEMFRRLQNPSAEIRRPWAALIGVLLAESLIVPFAEDAPMILAALPLCGASLLNTLTVLGTSASDDEDALSFWEQLVKGVSTISDYNLVSETKPYFESRLERIINERCATGQDAESKFDLAAHATAIPRIVALAVKLRSTAVILHLSASIRLSPLSSEARTRFKSTLEDTCKILVDHDLRLTSEPFATLLNKLLEQFLRHVLGDQPSPPHISRLAGPELDLGCVCQYCASLQRFLADPRIHRWHHIVPEAMHHSIYGPRCERIAQGSVIANCTMSKSRAPPTVPLYTYILHKRPVRTDLLAPREEWEKIVRNCSECVADWTCRSCREANSGPTLCRVCAQIKACMTWEERWRSLKHVVKILGSIQGQELFKKRQGLLPMILHEQPPEHPLLSAQRRQGLTRSATITAQSSPTSTHELFPTNPSSLPFQPPPLLPLGHNEAMHVRSALQPGAPSIQDGLGTVTQSPLPTISTFHPTTATSSSQPTAAATSLTGEHSGITPRYPETPDTRPSSIPPERDTMGAHPSSSSLTQNTSVAPYSRGREQVDATPLLANTLRVENTTYEAEQGSTPSIPDGDVSVKEEDQLYLEDTLLAVMDDHSAPSFARTEQQGIAAPAHGRAIPSPSLSHDLSRTRNTGKLSMDTDSTTHPKFVQGSSHDVVATTDPSPRDITVKDEDDEEEVSRSVTVPKKQATALPSEPAKGRRWVMDAVVIKRFPGYPWKSSQPSSRHASTASSSSPQPSQTPRRKRKRKMFEELLDSDGD